MLSRFYRAKTSGYPNWEKILKIQKERWEKLLELNRNGKNVLIATSVGSHLPGTTLESLLGVALTLRGASVHILLCDSILPACLACDVTWYPNQKIFVQHGPKKDLCKTCFQPAFQMFKSLGFIIHRYSDYLTEEDFRIAKKINSEISPHEIENYVFEGVSVGEHALSGALSFYARADLHGEPFAETVLRKYFVAALLTTFVTRNIFKKYNFQCTVFHHGIYVPQGLIGEVARNNNVKVINWNPAYRKKCFIFSHGDTYHHTLMSEPVIKWENIELTKELENQLMEYLKSRWFGSNDWIKFHKDPDFDLDKIGIDFSKPCIGMLTNVMWDAQLHYPANAFINMLEWVLKTIQYFSQRPELQLLIRIHPAEVNGSLHSRQPIIEEIKKAFPLLPKNIFIITPESPISTYAVMSKCNTVIIYGTKTGVELTSMGIPVIVAGEAWIRNKGITLDAKSQEEYFHLLKELPIKNMLDETTLKRARKYAFHFFFRRMIPLEILEPRKGWPPYRLKEIQLEDLMSGKNMGLDIVCNGILFGNDFIFPAEQIPSRRLL